MNRSALRWIWPLGITLVACGGAEFHSNGEGDELQWEEAAQPVSLRDTDRLPDFSFAGYRGGGVPLPPLASCRHVTLDAHQPLGNATRIQNAIDFVAASGTTGAVCLPQGTFPLGRPLHLRPGVVLRGRGSAGSTQTVLRVDKTLHELDPQFAYESNGTPKTCRNPLTGKDEKQSKWFAAGGFITFGGAPEDKSALGPSRNVVQAAKRGSRVIHVDAAGNLAAGDLILIRLHEPADQSLWKHLHAGLPPRPRCKKDDHTTRWVAQLARVSGNQLELVQPLKLGLRLEWQPVVRKLDPLREMGIEDLAIVFANTPYRGHQCERGFNAIAASNHYVADAWIRRVRIRNADNGILLKRNVFRTTVEEVRMESARQEATSGKHGAISGHYGIAAGSDCLIRQITFEADFAHDLSVLQGGNGNAFLNISGGGPLSIDHHGRGHFQNLYARIRGPYDFNSGGGSDQDAHGACHSFTGAYTTFWNFDHPLRDPVSSLGETEMPSVNFVGKLQGGAANNRLKTKGVWREHVKDPQPPNLYGGQLHERTNP